MKKGNHKWELIYSYIRRIECKKELWIAKKYGSSKKELQRWYKENKESKWNLISITKIY